MQKMKMHFNQLSADEQSKADFMMQLAYICQQVEASHISCDEGYEKVMQLLSDNELNAILQILYRRESAVGLNEES